MTVCITGSTGFIGAHVAKLAAEAHGPPRVTYRDEARLARLGGLEVEAVKADVLDRAALRRAFRGCEVVFHAAGLVGSRPPERVWQVNALAPRIAVEAAAAEEVRRVVVTSSVAGIGPAPADRPGTEEDVYSGLGAGADLPGRQARGRVGGAGGGSAAGGRGGGRQPVLRVRRPGRPLPAGRDLHAHDRQLPARAAARRWWTRETNVVDVRDVAKGHLLAAERGRAGERYVLGGHDAGWVELLERVGELSGVHHPLVVLPPEARRPALARGGGGDRVDGPELDATPRRRRAASSATAPARSTARCATRSTGTQELPGDGRPPSPMSLAAAGVRLAGPGRTARRPGGGGALRRPQAGGPPVSFFPRDEYFMRLALREAERALEHDDVPIGCVIVHGGEVIAAARNERELRGDPTAHAEILALREAAAHLGGWRLLDTVLYVTLEPCAMCAGAIVLARVPRVVYAAPDPKAGAAGSVLDVLGEPALNHRPDVAGGLLAEEAAEMLRQFFGLRRK